MNNDELRSKICKIIADNYLPKEMPDRLEDYKLYRFARAADALIAAGLKFGTVVSHTATFNIAQQERINELERENSVLRNRLAEAADFGLDVCGYPDCAGDDSVGIPPCPMWRDGDVDDSGNIVKGHCELAAWNKELLRVYVSNADKT